MKKEKKLTLINRIKGLFEKPVCWYDWVIFLLLALFAFLSFQMRDLLHTSGCSYGYLTGHFRDFYDYLAVCGIDEAGEPGLHASYLPTVYLLFAVWNLPMRILKIVTVPTAVLSITAVMWAKILPCLFYFAGAYLLYRIAAVSGFSAHKGKLLVYAYLSMPVAFYGQFVLGQYESIMVFFILAGFYCWLRKKNIAFTVWFSLAVTMKYTALIFFIPLVLLREKRIFRILFYVAGAMALTALEILFYHHSPAFLSYAFGVGSSGDNPTGYITNAAYFTGYDLGGNLKYVVYLAFLAFAFVCAYAYFLDRKEGYIETQYGVYLICLSAASFFCFSKWHPQWLMMAVPFWTLSAFMHKNTKIFMAVDLLFMVLFSMFVTCQFASVCDEIMLSRGIFKFILPGGQISQYAKMSDYLGKLDMSMELSLITAIIGVYGIFKHPSFLSPEPDRSADGSMGWIRARFILGMMCIFIPALLCVFHSVKTHETSYDERRRGVFAQMENGDEYVQEFTPAAESIDKLQFPVSRGTSFTEGSMRIRILDGEAVIYEDRFNVGNWTEGQVVSIVPEVCLPAGKPCAVSFIFETSEKDSTFSLLGFETDEESPAKKNGETLPYHLDMTIYQ